MLTYFDIIIAQINLKKNSKALDIWFNEDENYVKKQFINLIDKYYNLLLSRRDILVSM